MIFFVDFFPRAGFSCRPPLQLVRSRWKSGRSQNTVFKYSIFLVIFMPQDDLASAKGWHTMPQDKESLYRDPVAYHRELLHQAYTLRDAHIIDAGGLTEMLELADAALEHAREALIDACAGDM